MVSFFLIFPTAFQSMGRDTPLHTCVPVYIVYLYYGYIVKIIKICIKFDSIVKYSIILIIVLYSRVTLWLLFGVVINIWHWNELQLYLPYTTLNQTLLFRIFYAQTAILTWKSFLLRLLPTLLLLQVMVWAILTYHPLHIIPIK